MPGRAFRFWVHSPNTTCNQCMKQFYLNGAAVHSVHCDYAVVSWPALTQLSCLSLCHWGLERMLATAQPSQAVYTDNWGQEVCQGSKLPIRSLKLEIFKEEWKYKLCLFSSIPQKHCVSCVVSNQYLMSQWAFHGFRNTILKVQSTQRIKNNLYVSC